MLFVHLATQTTVSQQNQTITCGFDFLLNPAKMYAKASTLLGIIVFCRSKSVEHKDDTVTAL